jgi:hypothetical protein
MEFIDWCQVIDGEVFDIVAGLGQRAKDPFGQSAPAIMARHLSHCLVHSRVSTGIFGREGPHIRHASSRGPGPPADGWKGVIVSRHRFKVGQTVHLVPNRLERHVPGGAYTIQRPLPDEGRDLQYRVKNVQDGHERVVTEAQLRPAEALAEHH